MNFSPISRRTSLQVRIGQFVVGSEHPVLVQMAKTGHVTLADGSEREWFEEAK